MLHWLILAGVIALFISTVIALYKIDKKKTDRTTEDATASSPRG